MMQTGLINGLLHGRLRAVHLLRVFRLDSLPVVGNCWEPTCRRCAFYKDLPSARELRVQRLADLLAGIMSLELPKPGMQGMCGKPTTTRRCSQSTHAVPAKEKSS